MQFEIKNIGPVKAVRFTLKDFTVLTGKQSSGKSTIAKTVYFFRTIKDDIAKQISSIKISSISGTKADISLKRKVRTLIADKYDRIFEGMGDGDSPSKIRCEYSDGGKTYIEVENEKASSDSSTYRMRIHISQNIIDYLDNVYQRESTEEMIQQELAELFCDPYTTIYIPASRSLITTLGNQFIAFLSGMDYDSRRMIDPCTIDFLSMTIQLRENFSDGLLGIEKMRTKYVSGRKTKQVEARISVYKQAEMLSSRILSGSYYIINGSEKLMLNDGGIATIENASSGQQEALWIINILFYYLFARKTCFIIEEPESHLFPESQKYISDFMILVFNQGNQMIITTHSPYILQSADISMYAGALEKKRKIDKSRLHELVNKECELSADECNAFFVKDGRISDIIDPELREMDQAQLDEISMKINDIYNALVDLEQGNSK